MVWSLDLILMKWKSLDGLPRGDLDLEFKWFSFFSRQEPLKRLLQGQACQRVRSQRCCNKNLVLSCSLASQTSPSAGTVSGNVIVNTIAGVPAATFQSINKRLASPVAPGALTVSCPCSLAFW